MNQHEDYARRAGRILRRKPRTPRKTVNAYVNAYDIAAKLAKMDKGDDIAEFGPRILDLMRGVTWAVWQTLDEKPGLFGYMDDRFYMLRQVRNHPDYGRKLFDGLTERTSYGMRK